MTVPTDISVIKLCDDNTSQWDAFVNSHPESTPYHKSAWGQSVSEAYGFKYIGLMAIQNKTVVGILPLIILKSPLGAKRACSLPYCDAGGILTESKEVYETLVNYVIELSKAQSWQKTELRFASSEKKHELEQVAKVRMLLDLPDTSEQLLASFKSKLRSQIKKAEKNGLTASLNADEKHLDDFYQVYSRNMRDLGSPAHSKNWFRAIIKNYEQDVMIACVYYGELTVGAGLIIRADSKVSIPWASTKADYNRLAPNMLLYWTLLKYATDKGAKIFDFGRSTPGEGTYKFKKQWGALPAPLNWQTIEGGTLESMHNVNMQHSKVRMIVEQIWRQLPVSFATLIGAKIRKYISL